MTIAMKIHPALLRTIQFAVTGVVVVAAVFGTREIWGHYEADPWTRDGRVRADVVQIAPDVQGLVTQVFVRNDEVVHRGDPLFQIDRARYELAIEETNAAILKITVDLAQAEREAKRNHQLGDLVAAEVTEQSMAKVDADKAALASAHSALNLAKLNLQRTLVRAPSDGVLSDVPLLAGNYVSPGKPVMALVDSASLRVEGYFEETKLPNVHIGQAATVRVMGETRLLHGHVTSIASAIEDHDRQSSANGLPNINPSFSWVRLAQRVPVRISIDERPDNLALIAGRTASVTLDHPGQKGLLGARQPQQPQPSQQPNGGHK